jgi:uncharacterized repeat protein (TIGR01451 family)
MLQMNNPLGFIAPVRRGWLLIAAALFLFSISAPAFAQTNQYTNTATGSIVDSTTCATTVTRTFVVGTSYIVSDVDLGVFLTHTYRSDLRITLQSPTGTIVNIMTNTAGDGDNLNDLFNDEAASGIASHNAGVTDPTTAPPPYSHSFQPTAALSAFDGQNALGTWTMVICDSATADTGTFTRADLYITQVSTSYADLSLTKTVSNATPAFADTISYTLTLTNASGSPSTATGITVQDTLPAGVTFVSSTGTGSYNSGTGVWTVGSLAPGGVATLNIVVTVSAASGTVTNITQVTASSVADIDSTPNNGVITEDDYASRAFTVSARIAGTPPTLTCPAGTTTFDWDGRTWTAGTLSNNYVLTNVGTFGINISTSTPFVAGSPALNGNLTGGLSPVQNSLFLNMNNVALSDVSTTVIALPTAVPGMQFRLFDVDFGAGSFADKVTVTGSFNGSAVTPSLTNGVSNYVTGNVAIGDTGAADTAATGNVVVTFLAAVDTITVVYGNHTTAPANPGNQWMSVHDISFCNPVTNLTVTKTSSVVSDGVSATNPKALPSAVVRYCILISNAGSATANNVSVSDAIPATVTYTPGTLLSGTSCATAATAEDDNAAGADESDPFGVSVAGTTLTGTAASLGPASAFAIVFNATVN